MNKDQGLQAMAEPVTNKFLTEEYPKAVAFYDSGAVKAKRWFRTLSVYLIVVSAALTVLIAMSDTDDPYRWVRAGLSASIGVVTALLSHLKCHENWLSYRASWDALERERRLYEAGAGEYKDIAVKDTLFVERVEAVRTREGADFYSRHTKGEEQARKPPEST
jgi:hypothetical protein